MKYIHFSLLVVIVSIYGCQTPGESGTSQESDFSIDYEKFTLENGLEVVLHEDHSDPIVAVATLMHVGSNREKPGRTGFAHFFEHMSFNDSENVPVGANRKLIPEWGGSRNGGTWSDGTIYYEVVPKDAFEKILWIDSDRFGYMINTVTDAALEREKQVVKNEKRENYDKATQLSEVNQIGKGNAIVLDIHGNPLNAINWNITDKKVFNLGDNQSNDSIAGHLMGSYKAIFVYFIIKYPYLWKRWH